MQIQNLFTPFLPKKSTDHLRFGNLYGSSRALIIAQIAQMATAPLLVITPDALTANRLEEAVRFFVPELDILNFPDWEILPYDNFSPHHDIISQRLLTLTRLPQLKRGVLLISITTLLQRLSPKDYFSGTVFAFDRGEKIDLTTLRRRLEHAGYHCVSQVMEHGEFAVRGSILDLFPMGSEWPYRIDLFDDEIDSIRTFDPETQRSIENIEKIRLLPAREFPVTEESITRFRQQWREKFNGNPAACPIYQDVSQGFCPPGIEYYLPLFFEKTATLFDYLPENSLVIRLEKIKDQAEQFWLEIKERFEQGGYDITRPLLPPAELYLRSDDLFAQINHFPQIQLQTEPQEEGAGKYNFNTEKLVDLTINNKITNPLEKLQQFFNARDPKTKILFCAETTGRREVLFDLLKTISIHPVIYNTWKEFLSDQHFIGITIATFEEGFVLFDPPIVIIAEAQLFGQQVMQRRWRKHKTKGFESDAVVRNLAELNIGAPVVHIDQGVGRYIGLQTLKMGDVETEFVTLEYANNDKLYVPVSSLHLISRYSGGDLENAPLHKLGSDQWEKAKRRAATQVIDVAAELLDIYAKRAARQGHIFSQPDKNYSAFSAAFPFEETPDQKQAIEQVIQDMVRDKPMDRLICGDVGFGKTEVAMRAAFLAVQDGKQVAILVPTTLLAQQHYQTFKDRFSDWPVHIEVISRFRSTAEQKIILEKLKTGKIDIVIGTHKLIQKEIQFKNLGLLIIDEEHRFGVQQKEKLKAMRAEVDILTLTATPIPRTLNMAMSGLRELSIIATPPARRLSIKTFVRERNEALIREAILRELLRGGQIYFLHNEVENIEKIANELTALVPEARIGIAHGQMHERDLERAMTDFYHRRFNVLVCTTIIETGIDIPSANTIIMDRADKFGLAQLHQLRGRVGRSHHQAYAYLMIPNKKIMTPDAIKRLDAIADLEDLGVGFTLATHDLEIRGAGELLGEEQSGNMQEVGFSLYMELLERAVKALQAGEKPLLDKPLQKGAELDLQITALIPADYLPDVHTRLIFYKRIANAENAQSLQELQVEMIDRFGLLPEAIKNLFQLMELKLKSEPLGIRKIKANEQGGSIEFIEKPNLDPMMIIQLIQKWPHLYKLEGPQRLRFYWETIVKIADERMNKINDLLETLSGKKQN